jgi:hypothetical protein
MKTNATLIFTFSLFFLLFGAVHLIANRTIKGSVSCDGIEIPDMAGVRVNAFDADGNEDELMGQTYLDDSKTFEIKYENKKWDPFPMDFITWWRPDIYLTVEIYEEEEWITVYQSEIYEDWKTNYDLELHIYVEFNEPLVKTTPFSPMQHGWPFHTLYVDKQSGGVLGGSISGGLCFGALDNFYGHQATGFPSAEAFEQYLLSRRDDAAKAGGTTRQYQAYLTLPDRRPWTKRESLAYETKEELKKVRAKIEEGKPVILVLLSEADNGRPLDDLHQVVAYKYEYDQTRRKTRLWIYDPERVRQEEAVLTVIHGAPDGSVRVLYPQEKHWSFRGFFINSYDKEEKRKAFAALPAVMGRIH